MTLKSLITVIQILSLRYIVAAFLAIFYLFGKNPRNDSSKLTTFHRIDRPIIYLDNGAAVSDKLLCFAKLIDCIQSFQTKHGPSF